MKKLILILLLTITLLAGCSSPATPVIDTELQHKLELLYAVDQENGLHQPIPFLRPLPQKQGFPHTNTSGQPTRFSILKFKYLRFRISLFVFLHETSLFLSK